MKILHISDTHGHHNGIIIPKDVDMLIHSGDATNYKNEHMNYLEMVSFYEWWIKLDVKYKIYVAGNHDTAIEKGIFNKRLLENNDNSFYLENDDVEIEGIKFYGTPYVPVFGQWAFERADNKLFKAFEFIPDDTDVLITHTPPKYMLDLAEKPNHQIEYCGSKHLLNKILEIKPKYHLFGHIHNNGEQINVGKRVYKDITFVNSAAVTDRKFDYGITYQGTIIEI